MPSSVQYIHDKWTLGACELQLDIEPLKYASSLLFLMSFCFCRGYFCFVYKQVLWPTNSGQVDGCWPNCRLARAPGTSAIHKNHEISLSMSWPRVFCFFQPKASQSANEMRISTSAWWTLLTTPFSFSKVVSTVSYNLLNIFLNQSQSSGNKEFGIPPLEPLSVKKLVIDAGTAPINLRQALKNVKVHDMISTSKIQRYRYFSYASWSLFAYNFKKINENNKFQNRPGQTLNYLW